MLCPCSTSCGIGTLVLRDAEEMLAYTGNMHLLGLLVMLDTAQGVLVLLLVGVRFRSRTARRPRRLWARSRVKWQPILDREGGIQPCRSRCSAQAA